MKRNMRTCKFAPDKDGDNIEEMSHCKHESNCCPHFRAHVWCPYYKRTMSFKERTTIKNGSDIFIGLCMFACVIAFIGFMIVIR